MYLVAVFLVLLEGREPVGGGRNGNLSHLLEVRSAYQRVFQPTDREERRGEIISYGTHTHWKQGRNNGIMVTVVGEEDS